MSSHSKAPPRSGGKRGSSEAEIATRQRELYALPLDQFTRARDALAKELASKGRAKDAQAIRKLKRPVVGAWVVNRLAQQQPEHLGEFLDSARALEKAHRRAMSGLASEPFKEANRAFQQSLDALMKDITALLAATGRPATGDLIRQVEETLRTAALGTEEERTVLTQGTLTQPLRSSGFGSFSPLLLVGPSPAHTSRKPARAPPGRRPEKPPAPPAPAPPPAGGKVLRGPWTPREDEVEAPARPPPAAKPRIAPPVPHPPKRQAREAAAAEARHQREAELRQLRREAKQRADEAARADRSARQALVRTQAALRTTKGKTLQARRALENAESQVRRAREALEGAEEAERVQAEEASRVDEQATAAKRELTHARRHLEQAESRVRP
ncbi:hypothetical protein [Hyalangium sp.]|uniref:hypothetical protein n=1 Tax=Hyalangium sp. TaxID=2028555 RepID=UPI002D5F2F69|nr:hypothetical protein [Hyalangium sp.]HYH97210.1 hypothetical protein [Hyalangium sp.]